MVVIGAAILPSLAWANYSMAQDIIYSRPALIPVAVFIELLVARSLVEASLWKGAWVVLVANALSACLGAIGIFDMTLLPLLEMWADQWGNTGLELIRLGWGFVLSVGFEGVFYRRWLGKKGYRASWAMNGASYLMFVIVFLVAGTPSFSMRAPRNATQMSFASIDQAFKRFKEDFGAYPRLVGSGQPHTPEQWTVISKALCAKDPGAMEIKEVLRHMPPRPKKALTPSDVGYKGPYMKARNGVKLDGWGRPFLLIVDNVKDRYRLYSKGQNGVDDHGANDDLVSEGSRLN